MTQDTIECLEKQNEFKNEKLVFAINAGSSSLKATLLLNQKNRRYSPKRLLIAHAERLMSKEAFISIKALTCMKSLHLDTTVGHTHPRLLSRSLSKESKSGDINKAMKYSQTITNTPNMSHKDALRCIVESIESNGWLQHVNAIGHRVVHGGVDFSTSTIVDDSILAKIESNIHLAPLHNPANCEGIHIMRELLPSVPSIAVFDTSFHSTIPARAYTYPLPGSYRDGLQIRKYGFHGTSVQYVANKAYDLLHRVSDGRRKDGKMIIAHLGNGASVTAVVDGKSVDTTMGFTPLEGLMMGTRSGSIDPSIVAYVSKAQDKDPETVVEELNKLSGLKGVCGNSDMRVVLESAAKGESSAVLALDMFTYILAKYVMGMAVACGGDVDALVFTAGIGENSPLIRSRTCNLVSKMLKVELDETKNIASTSADFCAGLISPNGYKPVVAVIPTDEEAMICDECIRLTSLC